MAEYIDREKIRDEACNGCTHRIGKDGCGWPEPCKRLLGALISAEPEDVAPVVHAKWVRTEEGDWECSHCKESVVICECGKDRTRRKMFCPNCGAKMDGEEIN